MNMHPGGPPIGMSLWRTTQLVMSAFDKVLAEHGGNRPVWFILITLDEGVHTTQRDLARAVGIQEATLTHHLNALERRGLIVRTRDLADRRVQRIEFTPEGRRALDAMRSAAVAFDVQIREALGPDGVAALRDGLDRLADAVRGSGDGEVRPPIE